MDNILEEKIKEYLFDTNVRWSAIHAMIQNRIPISPAMAKEYKDAIDKLYDIISAERQRYALGIIGDDEKIVRLRKPTHGNCCTCQDCGMWHDECRCGEIGERNEFRATLRSKLSISKKT